MPQAPASADPRRMDMTRMRFGILAVAIPAFLAIVCCGGRRGAAGVVSSSELGTYPKETVALLVLEVKRVRTQAPEIPWVKNLAGLADRDDGPFREVLHRLGPDVLE